MSTPLGQIEISLLWNRLISIVEEQAQTLIRTAFSTTVREAGDLSAGVFDRHGQMLAQAVTGTPGHVNAMAASVGKFLEYYPLSDLTEGDVLVTNDPWDGTGHLNDFTVVTPVFRAGEPIGLFAATSHIADVGGLGFGPDANEVFEEGLLVPISKLFERGEPNKTLFHIIRANVRDPIAAEGDLYSLSACNEVGAVRLLEALDEFALEDLESIGTAIIEQSRSAMLKEIESLPFGRYENTMRIDGYDTPVDLACQVSISSAGIAIEFDGVSAQSPFGINVPLTYTQAYASFGVRCVIGNEIPNNAGSLGVVDVCARPGSILNATRPAAVSARHVIGQMLPDVVLGALAKAIPERIPAEGASCLYLPVLRGENFILNPFYTGGMGARMTSDGLSCTAFPSGVRNTPVEINEAMSPIVMWRKEFNPDSGGAGEYRGGLGQVMEFAHLEEKPFLISKMFDRFIHPARGRGSGHNGGVGQAMLGSGRKLSGMGRDNIEAGDRLILHTAGGGGVGDPMLRPRSKVDLDVKSGLVTPKAAKKFYGH